MLPTDETRAALALRQAALVNALISGGEPPPGFDSQRLLAAAESLARKRRGPRRGPGRDWAHALGNEVPTSISPPTPAALPLPSEGGPLADGFGFTRWLSGRGCLPEAGRMEVMAVGLRYRCIPAGLAGRRWPSLRVAWSRQSRRVMIAVRIPRVGERWFSV